MTKEHTDTGQNGSGSPLRDALGGEHPLVALLAILLGVATWALWWAITPA